MTTSHTAPKLGKYASGGVLNGLVVVTVGAADSQVLVGRSAIEPAQWYKVVCMPSPINRMKTIVTETPLSPVLVTSPAFESLRKLLALKGVTLTLQS